MRLLEKKQITILLSISIIFLFGCTEKIKVEEKSYEVKILIVNNLNVPIYINDYDITSDYISNNYNSLKKEFYFSCPAYYSDITGECTGEFKHEILPNESFYFAKRISKPIDDMVYRITVNDLLGNNYTSKIYGIAENIEYYIYATKKIINYSNYKNYVDQINDNGIRLSGKFINDVLVFADR